MKRSRLEEAAQELNTFMDLEPKINIKSQIKELKQKVYEAGCLLEPGEEDLSIAAGQRPGESKEQFEARKAKVQRIQEVLRELKVPLFTRREKEQEQKTMEPKEVDNNEVIEKETTEDVTSAEETQTSKPEAETKSSDLIEMVQEVTKLTDLKAIVETEEQFTSLRQSLDQYKGLQGPRLLKAEMLRILGVGTNAKEQSSKKTKNEGSKAKVPKWKMAIQLIVDNPEITASELIAQMEKLPCGALNEKSSVIHVQIAEYAIQLYKAKIGK